MNQPKSDSSTIDEQENAFVQIRVVTWQKDSYGLFDYDYNSYQIQNFCTAKPVIIGRNGNAIDCWSKHNHFTPDQLIERELLLSISQGRKDKNRFWVGSSNQINCERHFHPKEKYLIVRSLKSDNGRSQMGYPLSVGDCLKLGRIEFFVREMKVWKNINKPGELKLLKTSKLSKLAATGKCPKRVKDITSQALKAQKDPSLTCRYCFLNKIWDEPVKDLLIDACECKGTNGLVHLGCLANWIQCKITSQNGPNIATYTWEKLQCEVCTSSWPPSVCFQNQEHSLISVEKPDCPYILLEQSRRNADSELQAQSLTLIIPDKQIPIKLGRGQKSNFKISDISVSRIHAFLQFYENNFRIFDNDSKFGTLIKLTKRFEIKPKKFAIQIGRTVFTLALKYPQDCLLEDDKIDETDK